MDHTLSEYPLAILESVFEYAKANPDKTVDQILEAIPDPPVDDSGEKQLYFDKEELIACVDYAKANSQVTFVQYFKLNPAEPWEIRESA